MISVIRTRHLTPTQLTDVSSLHLTLLKESVFSSFGNRFTQMFYQSAIKNPETIFLTLRKNKKVIGFALGLKNPARFLNSLFPPIPLSSLLSLFLPKQIFSLPELQFIVVDSEYQRSGYGRLLIKSLSKEFSKMGFTTFTVGTSAQNPAPNNFYRRLGFSHLGRYRVFGKLQNFYVSK